MHVYFTGLTFSRKEFGVSRAQFKEDIVKIADSIITESEVVIQIAVRVADACTNVTMREVGTILFCIFKNLDRLL